MAVVAVWRCDRDGAMFDSKKEADAYDKMLELGEHFSALVERELPGVDEEAADQFGLLLAKNKDLLLKALKGQPESLTEIGNDSKVASLAAAG